MFGLHIAGLRGKTVRRSPTHVYTNYVAVPKDFLTAHWDITLMVDMVMFVNGLPFQVIKSRGITLVKNEFDCTRTDSNLAMLLACVINVYKTASFAVQTILMEMSLTV